MSAQVSFSELLNTFEWVSTGGPYEHSALVSRATGKIFWLSDVIDDEELPDDIEDDSLYIAVPHKNELEVGRRLALRFVEEHMPSSYEVVAGYFSRRGAYARFKDLLERTGRLEDWYAYEAGAVERALRQWCEENGLDLIP